MFCSHKLNLPIISLVSLRVNLKDTLHMVSESELVDINITALLNNWSMQNSISHFQDFFFPSCLIFCKVMKFSFVAHVVDEITLLFAASLIKRVYVF